MFTTNLGTDELYGHAGDDNFTINGTGNKTISGGTGTDTVNFRLFRFFGSNKCVDECCGTPLTINFNDGSSAVASNIEAVQFSGNSYQIYNVSGYDLTGSQNSALRSLSYDQSSPTTFICWQRLVVEAQLAAVF